MENIMRRLGYITWGKGDKLGEEAGETRKSERRKERSLIQPGKEGRESGESSSSNFFLFSFTFQFSPFSSAARHGRRRGL